MASRTPSPALLSDLARLFEIEADAVFERWRETGAAELFDESERLLVIADGYAECSELAATVRPEAA